MKSHIHNLNWIRLVLMAVLVAACGGCLAAGTNNQGVDQYNAGNYDQAISLFTEAITLNPSDAKAYNNRGLAYYKENNFDKALADFNKAIELDANNAKAYNNRGIVYFKQNNCPKAKADFQKAVSIDPSDTTSQANLKAASAKC